ncbi:MAG: diguanylate cyclase [Aquabacterium sp.]|uniref:GGDEF domain-containing protein n=1 Tax=Aquabacterium sp. TaxID=1872578 RepID=UPI0025C3EC5C|nr:diguanylate cyclase [Aquabacterium sp.]MBI5924503.1 diguanylate cyclase [Aquabacterium sp.]
MRVLIERFIISSTPAWRVLLAVFASVPFFMIEFMVHGWGLAMPEIRAGLNPGVMWFLQGVFVLATVIEVSVALWLWPRRHQHDAVPRATLLVCLSIGLGYTTVTILAGMFTAAPNLILLGVLAIGLLLFERRPMLISYVVCVSMMAIYDAGSVAQWWPYAPALTPQVMQGREPVWWFAFWRQLVFVLGYAVLLSLLLLLFDRLDLLHAKLRRLSYTDGLTGLANRRRAMEVLNNEVARQARTGQTLALVLIDADHFKQVNDQYGHDMGDKVLRALGKLLMACVRSPTDVACRLGGEEFALILPDTRHEQVEAVCARLRQQLALQTFGEGDATFKVTLSMGVVEGSRQGAEQLLQLADHALYRAKSTGRDRVCMADSAMGVA